MRIGEVQVGALYAVSAAPHRKPSSAVVYRAEVWQARVASFASPPAERKRWVEVIITELPETLRHWRHRGTPLWNATVGTRLLVPSTHLVMPWTTLAALRRGETSRLRSLRERRQMTAESAARICASLIGSRYVIDGSSYVSPVDSGPDPVISLSLELSLEQLLRIDDALRRLPEAGDASEFTWLSRLGVVEPGAAV